MEHKIWEEEFTKKDGTRRRMRFYRLGDMRAEDRARLGIPPASQRPHMPIPEGSPRESCRLTWGPGVARKMRTLAL